MRKFFDPDNMLWQDVGYIGDLVITSCLWVLGCVGIITAGASCIAMYDVTAHCVKKRESGMVQRFFHTFLAEMKTGIKMTLLWLLIFMILTFAHQGLLNFALIFPQTKIIALLFFGLIPLSVGILAWAFALESRFHYSFRALHKNAVLMALGYLPRTLLVILLAVLAFIGCSYFPVAAILLPGIAVRLHAAIMEPVLEKYT